MPVSPADFEFYSRITGQPIPRDPASRMKVAPQVYAMRRGPLSGIRERLGGAAKGALAAGALAGVGALVSQVADEERPDMGVPQEQSQISLGGVAKRDVVASDILRKVSDFTSRVSAPTTGELYGQEQVGNQTSSNVFLRSQGQVEEIASNPEPITQAEELTNSQPLEPTGIASTPEVSAATNVAQQTSAQNLTASGVMSEHSDPKYNKYYTPQEGVAGIRDRADALLFEYEKGRQEREVGKMRAAEMTREGEEYRMGKNIISDIMSAAPEESPVRARATALSSSVLGDKEGARTMVASGPAIEGQGLPSSSSIKGITVYPGRPQQTDVTFTDNKPSYVYQSTPEFSEKLVEMSDRGERPQSFGKLFNEAKKKKEIISLAQEPLA